MWAIGHDPNIWDNPWKFWLERFLDNDNISVNVEFVLASFLHSFKLKACGEQNLMSYLAQSQS